MTATPRPARERGRTQVRAMAYQRALADLREKHRDEFDELWELHKQMLGKVTT